MNDIKFDIRNFIKLIIEITVLGAGLLHLIKDIECLIDIGGQDFKIIKVRPDKGGVERFIMNDKCSAGTGQFISTLLNKLDISFDKLDDLYFKSDESVRLSSVCTVFAVTEAVAYLSSGVDVDAVLRGALDVIVEKIYPYVENIGEFRYYTISGGLSEKKGVINAFEKRINGKFIPVNNSLYLAAIGAAKIGHDLINQK